MDELLAGRWLAQVEEQPLSLAMRLTFNEGHVYENSLAVGRYLVTVEGLVAQIGDDATLTIRGNPRAHSGYSAELVSRDPGDPDDPLRQYVTLFPDVSDA